jgi:hypothetical protein
MKAETKAIFGWQSVCAFFLVFGFMLITMNFAHADGVRKNIPTKLVSPPAELTPLKKVDTPTLVVMPVVVEAPKDNCQWLQKESISYEPGTSVFVPGMLVSAPACGCCGAQATWLNGASYSSSPQTSKSVTLQLVCQ